MNHPIRRKNDQLQLPYDRYILTALLLLLLSYLTWVAIHLRLDYFDSYHLLLNARKIASLQGDNYNFLRTYLPVILLSPIFALEKIIGTTFLFSTCHVIAVMVFALFLFIFHKMASVFLGNQLALLSVFLIGLNPLLIHYAPFAKEDILGALWAILAFYFYDLSSSQKNRRFYILSGLSIFAAMATRYQLIPLFFAVIGINECLCLWGKIRTSPKNSVSLKEFGLIEKLVWLFAMPIFLFCAVPTILYALIGRSPLPQATGQFLNEILFLLKQNSEFGSAELESSSQNYRFIAKACTWPVLFCSLVGIVSGLRRNHPKTRLYILWLFIFFLFQTYAITHQEARYLFPIFPPIYLLASLGVGQIHDWVKRGIPAGSGRLLLQITLWLLIFTLPVQKAVSECLKFSDPIYSSDFGGRLSRYIENRSDGSHQVFWVGPFYTLHPKDYVFDLDDEFAYIYHLFTHVINFYSLQKVSPLTYFQKDDEFPDEPNFLSPESVNTIASKDLIVVNPQRSFYKTKNAPLVQEPLLINQVQKLNFKLESNESGIEKWTCSLTSSETAEIQIQFLNDKLTLTGSKIPDGHYQIYIGYLDQENLMLFSYGEVRSGRFFLDIKRKEDRPDIESLTMVSYKRVAELSP